MEPEKLSPVSLRLMSEYLPGWDAREMAELLDKPRFDEREPGDYYPFGGKCHNWRNHVPESIKDAWPELSYETRAALFAMAEYEAGREEWD